MTWTPDGAFLSMALEQAPNAEKDTNKISTNVFYLPARQFDDVDGWAPLDEQDALKATLALAPHLGTGTYAPKPKMSKLWPRPSHMGLLLAAQCGTIVTTVGDGIITDPDAQAVPVGAYKHVISFKALDPPQTVQWVAGTADGQYRKGTGMGFDKLAFAVDSGAWGVEADMTGLYLTDEANPTVSPTYDLVEPFRTGDMTLTWLNGSAYTREFTFEISNTLEALYQLGVQSYWPSLLQYTDDINGRPHVMGTIKKRVLNATDLAAMYAGTQFDVKIKLGHRQAIGATAYHHGVWLDVPGCQYVGAARDPIENKRRREGTFTWEARATGGSSVLATVTVVNDTAAYATYPG